MTDIEKAFSRKNRHLRSLRAIRSDALNILKRQGSQDGNLDKLLTTCKECGGTVKSSALREKGYACPLCGAHLAMPAKDRLAATFDRGRYHELDQHLAGTDPLYFKGYQEKVDATRQKTGMTEAAVAATGSIGGKKCVVVVLDPQFFMGSMGTTVGEKVTRATEYATKKKLPLVIFSASGGARMQEGIFSLMQMAKTSAAIAKHKNAGLLYISIMTNPTTGGVTASFASLGHIILAEPNALIGFAGPRVIKQTINQDLPKGFQRAESQLADGFVDAIVQRKNMTSTISNLLAMYDQRKVPFRKLCPQKAEELTEGMNPGSPTYNLSPVDRLALARHPKRPHASAYIGELFEDFFELHGDRRAGDDHSISGGFARFHGAPVMVIGQCKGDDVETNIRNNFAMPQPEGYRKVQRLASLAEVFGTPIVTLIDTPGAYPGIEAERRGQGEAIASCLAQFSELTVPVVAFVIGEGGSGGALALGVADSVIMLENAVYSILSPEGFAAILWKDSSRSAEAADVMKITAADLKGYGVVDQVIYEGNGGASENRNEVLKRADIALAVELIRLSNLVEKNLLEERYARYRAFGSYRTLKK